jgi:hypothetical protein
MQKHVPRSFVQLIPGCNSYPVPILYSQLPLKYGTQQGADHFCPILRGSVIEENGVGKMVGY